MKHKIGLFLLFWGLLLLTPAVFAAPAWQFAPAITENGVTVSYPEEATFAVAWEGAEVTAVTLRYDVERFSCIDATSEVEVAFSGNGAEWTWEMIRSGNPPPGAVLTWEWELTGADGETFTTPAQQFTFVDERFDWETIAADNIELHWYRGDDVGPQLLEAAVSGLDQIQREMGITLTDDVQFFIYGDSDDMRDAVLYVQEWAGGVAFTEYNTILIGVPPNSAASWGQPTVRHELAHLVVAQFGRSCVGGSRPTWLDEGIAVYFEGAPSDRVRSDIASGTENNSFFPLRGLNGSFPAESAAAGMAYSQSYSVVEFMLAEYGSKPLQALLLALAEGDDYDDAVTAVYGINIDGLEQAWRAEMGLPARQIPATPTPISAAMVPTIAPLGAPQDVPTPPSAAATAVPPTPGNDGAAIPALCNLAVLPLAAIGLFSRRRRRQA